MNFLFAFHCEVDGRSENGLIQTFLNNSERHQYTRIFLTHTFLLASYCSGAGYQHIQIGIWLTSVVPSFGRDFLRIFIEKLHFAWKNFNIFYTPLYIHHPLACIKNIHSIDCRQEFFLQLAHSQFSSSSSI